MKNNNLRDEIVGGITTFLTMSYIVIVNPSILSTQGTGMNFNGVLTATVILCFSMTLLMGLYAKLPFGVAPGMGINAFFTYSLILGQNVPWQQALGCVVLAGIIFFIASVTPIRIWIVNSIPHNLRSASSVGIGLFLTFIGLKNAGLVVADPVTFVKLGKFTTTSLLAIAGLGISIYFFSKKNPLAFIFSILFSTVIGFLIGDVKAPDSYLSTPDFSSVFFKFDLIGALKPTLLIAMVGIFFTDLFDSISSLVGVSQATGLVEKNGEPKNLKQGLIVDALATFFAGIFGTSSGTAYIESAAGIEAGGKTGLSAIITALCFLPCLFIAPIAGMVPSYATAPVLIFVGGLMFKSVRELHLSKLEDVIPSFLTIILIPLTFSITQGIIWGFISHVALYFLTGRRKELNAGIVTIALLSLGILALGN